ncbi:hypothetical protein Y032_0007g3173 [Ancylostoma ceylanicum]|uniref:Uncharacterized protein n=1 Tax=Ancylostoma ceylanicum TaxID=53326 RepID=A0A016VL44_9BILA|nr:hypothetical protein Y032_0007g3173 [Ancylostoma ceylanicum]
MLHVMENIKISIISHSTELTDYGAIFCINSLSASPHSYVTSPHSCIIYRANHKLVYNVCSFISPPDSHALSRSFFLPNREVQSTKERSQA